MVWDSGPKAWTLEIQPQPAEQLDRVVQTKAPAFEELELVVEPFDEATVIPALEVVENPVFPVIQGVEELIKTAQARRLDPRAPGLDPGLGGSAIRGAFKDRR